jgi:hypothetical protein
MRSESLFYFKNKPAFNKELRIMVELLVQQDFTVAIFEIHQVVVKSKKAK